MNLILTQLKTENTITETENDISYYDCQELTDDTTLTNYTHCEMNNIQALPAKTASVDLTDIKIMTSALKGYAAMLKLYSAYSITGQKHITNEIQLKELKNKKRLTDKEMHNIIAKHPNYLVLESDNKISEIIKDLEQIVEIGMDLETFNNQFCNNESRLNNLIKPICFSDTAKADMEKTLEFLSGPQEAVLGLDKNEAEVKIVIDLPAYLNNPVNDLKTLTPNEYDHNGKSKYSLEPELNGLFPNKDLLEKLKQIKSE